MINEEHVYRCYKIDIWKSADDPDWHWLMQGPDEDEDGLPMRIGLGWESTWVEAMDAAKARIDGEYCPDDMGLPPGARWHDLTVSFTGKRGDG